MKILPVAVKKYIEFALIKMSWVYVYGVLLNVILNSIFKDKVISHENKKPKICISIFNQF